MTDQETRKAKFPVRLSRRLALAVAMGVTAFLFVGGFSVVLSLNIARLHRIVDQERQHMRMVSEIGEAFYHLIYEIQHVQLTGGAGSWDLRVLRDELFAAVDRFRTIHSDDAGLPEDMRERAAFTSLSENARSIKPFVEILVGDVPARSRLEPGDLDTLSRVAHEVPEESAALSKPHETRVTRLLEMTRRIERIIIVLYVAMFSLGCALVVVAGWTLHRNVAAPLRMLAGAAHGITEGSLEERVPVKSRDEIGQLSNAFNVMADRLQGRERDLRGAQARLERKVRDIGALNQIGNQMLALDGPTVILRTIVDTARANLGLDAAAVCVRGSESGELVAHSISGPDEAFRVRAGTVCRVTDWCAGERHALAGCPVIRAEYARSHLAVPLTRGEESIGTLCVASREERVLSVAETEFLVALAAQAAITFEHARLDAEVRRLAVLEERTRIARDMHDGLAQSVSLLHLRLRQTQAQVPPELFPAIGNALEEIAILSGEMHDEVRCAIAGLRIVALEHQGFIATLAEFVHEFSVQNHFAVEFSSNEVAADGPSSTAEPDVIRIVQEALNNVRKHAQTDRAQVRAECQGAWLRVSVEDNGRGFDPAKMAAEDGIHFGLRGMQERADRCAGTLDVESIPGHGTRVVLSVPLETPS